jgi:hypothetical protein
MAEDPIYNAIQALRSDLARVDHAIQVIESLALGKPRRGRPPKFLAEMAASATPKKKRGRPKKTAQSS